MTRKHQTIKSGKHNSINIRSIENYTKDLFIQKMSEIQFPNYSYFENVNDEYQDLLTLCSSCDLESLKVMHGRIDPGS